MSEPARNTVVHDAASRPPMPSGPLRDWLAAMRATAPESRPTETATPQTAALSALEAKVAALDPKTAALDFKTAALDPKAAAVDPKATAWAPRLVVPAETPAVQDDEIAELIAENMMLKAKLRLEADRRDEFQLLLAQEIRGLRAHVAEEVAKLEDLRGERDLWKARCEALMQPLFSGGAR